MRLLSRLFIYGAGGHGKVVLEAVRALGEYSDLVFLDDDPECIGTSVLGVPVKSGPQVLDSGPVASIIVALGANDLRATMGRRFRRKGWNLVSVVHPTAYVAGEARLGEGVFLAPGAIVGVDCLVSDFCIVNTHASIDHEGRCQEAVHLGPGCRLGGRVCVGPRAFIGLNASVRQGIKIGADAVVGAGAAVVSDVPAGTTVVGVPARPVSRPGPARNLP